MNNTINGKNVLRMIQNARAVDIAYADDAFGIDNINVNDNMNIKLNFYATRKDLRRLNLSPVNGGITVDTNGASARFVNMMSCDILYAAFEQHEKLLAQVTSTACAHVR